MKLVEILPSASTEEQLTEITAKQVIAAGAIALAALGVHQRSVDKADYAANQAKITQTQDSSSKITQAAAKLIQQDKASKVSKTSKEHKLQVEINKLAQVIAAKYKNIDAKEAKAIVAIAKKYEKPVFPKAKDILAIIGIESSYNVNAVSKLKKDPAIGLMQVRPKTWGITAAHLNGNIDAQIAFGSSVLEKYHDKLGNKEDAIKAYNIGLTNFKKGKQVDAQDRYISKYQQELNLLNKM